MANAAITLFDYGRFAIATGELVWGYTPLIVTATSNSVWNTFAGGEVQNNLTELAWNKLSDGGTCYSKYNLTSKKVEFYTSGFIAKWTQYASSPNPVMLVGTQKVGDASTIMLMLMAQITGITIVQNTQYIIGDHSTPLFTL